MNEYKQRYPNAPILTDRLIDKFDVDVSHRNEILTILKLVIGSIYKNNDISDQLLDRLLVQLIPY